MSEIDFFYTLGINDINRNQPTREKLPFLFTFRPGDDLIDTLHPPKNNWDFLLLLDNSGSMSQQFNSSIPDVTKHSAIKQAALGLMPVLDENDSITIFNFNTGTEQILARSPGSDHRAIRSAIENMPITQRATDFEAALDSAKKFIKGGSNPSKLVIFLTDGIHYASYSGGGTKEGANKIAGEMAREGVIVDCMGVGIEPDMDFLDKMAANGGGKSAYLTSPDEAQERFEDTVSTARSTFISNARLRLEFPPSSSTIEVFSYAPENRYHTPDLTIDTGGITHINLPPFSIDEAYEFLVEVDVQLDSNKRAPNQLLCSAYLTFNVPQRGIADSEIQLDVKVNLTGGEISEERNSDIEYKRTDVYLSKYFASLNKAISDRDAQEALRVLRILYQTTASNPAFREQHDSYLAMEDQLKQNGVLTQEELNIIRKVSSSASIPAESRNASDEELNDKGTIFM